MMFVKRRTAIKALAGLALYVLGGVGALALAAQVAGTVVNLSGPLMVKKADGSVKVLALRSEVEQGDTLVSEKNTYAQIRFIDNSEITLKPGTTFTIDAFAYDAGKPDGDSASFNLLKGGLRSVTGLLGKRNKEKFSLKTPTSTIGIRGTTFIAQVVPPLPISSVPRAPGALAPGLPAGVYVYVLDGAIFVANQGGSTNFTAGQVGFTSSFTAPPVMLPTNPGVQFTLPASFGPVASRPSGAGASGGKTEAVDCIVR